MIEWAFENQLIFFGLLFVQYVLLFEFQVVLEKTRLLKPLVIWFILQDWLMNMFMTLWFLDLPEKANELVTGRLKRYKQTGGYSKRGVSIELIEEFRYHFAVIVCRKLSIHDKGHC